MRGVSGRRHPPRHRCTESVGTRRTGRPYWATAVLGPGGGGEAGVCTILQMLRDELEMAMSMCGRPTIASIDRSLLGTVSRFYPSSHPPQGLHLPSL